MTPANYSPKYTIFLTTVSLCALLIVTAAHATDRDKAKRIHDRIAGVPPAADVLDAMEADIAAGNEIAAAEKAMENDAFYNVTLKNMVTPWTNQEQSVFEPLNDYTATVIGMVRDDVDMRLMLSADLLYIGSGSLGLPSYSEENNDHYVALENGGYSLKDNLVASTQSEWSTALETQDTAGVMTTRAAAKEFFDAGTNRAMFRFTLMNHFCRDLEQVKDITRPPDRIRQDVSRSPGGDSQIFLNNCIGCHSGMDPLAQAFAYYQWDGVEDAEEGQLRFNAVGMTDDVTGTRVQAKYHINNNNFPYGYITMDDGWVNYWREGPNAALGWNTDMPGYGNGAKSMGEELANSYAYSECQVRKVFKNVCLRDPSNDNDRTTFNNMVDSFIGNGYLLKPVFAQAAVHCMGN